MSNRGLRAKYDVTGRFYDFLDYYWERQYRVWRPKLLADMSGRILEAGVGTGRNLRHYPPGVEVVAIDLSPRMLAVARRRARNAACDVSFALDDATLMRTVPDASVDWVVSTFMCCVMPDELQPRALEQMARVIRPGGRLRLLEIVYSKSARIRRRQERFAAFVEKVYGARFDRETRRHVAENPDLEITGTRFVKDDTYLVIDGRRR